MNGGRIKQEPMRLTVASECSRFVVSGLCQRLQKTLCELNIVITLIAKRVVKRATPYGYSKRSTNIDSLVIYHPLPLFRLASRIQSRCLESLPTCIITLRYRVQTSVWMSGLRFSLRRYVVIALGATIKVIIPTSHNMLQMPTPSTPVHLMHKTVIQQVM